MNGYTEDEIKKREEAIIQALIGLDVRVRGGDILKDTFSKPLVREGAEAIVDRLRARGFKIERV